MATNTDQKLNNYVLTKQKADASREKIKQQNIAQEQKLHLELVNCPEEAEYRIKDYDIAKMIGTALSFKYPGHGWQVEADSRNGIARIYMSQLSSREGYIYKLKNISLGSFDAEMMRVGGEMLERFGIKRGRFNEVSIVDVKRDLRGNAKADLS